MANLTVSLPTDIHNELKKYEEVNWSGVVRKAIEQHLHKMKIADALAEKSKLTEKDVEELDSFIKKEITRQHG